MREGYFHCFDRFQQRGFRSSGRITNRCWTDKQPSMKGQTELKRKAMTEAEARAVVTLTGHKCFLEERFA